ncbi:hypothetical protein [Ectothiorhodospira shaposhnikovii]|uniref:hypothetical protein n=1 Tax=Ectothiorhodospira shaposhnikovii TaxID=1054 RepID=UPI001EE7FC0E|nr:hypothetical protein [Ectothiorhodospira shaposhnikovii]MCG5512802.1 hypothetical protein [Ectothiorhodospira shaposhnikovii]
MKYYTKDRARITKEIWLKLRFDKKYSTIKEFENEKIRVVAEWYGAIDDNQSVTIGFGAPLFRVVVMNATDIGAGIQWVEDHSLSKGFEIEKEAIAHYESVVAKWTESYLEEVELDNGNVVEVLVEIGNKVAPEVPPDPRSVNVEAYSGNDAAGSW